MLPALLLLLAQDAGRIDALIRDLDADAVTLRDEAARELFKIGEPAIPALERALEKAKTEELKSRAGSVIASIHREQRRKAFKGGPVVAGLSACASVDVRDRCVVVTVEIMNVSTKSTAFAPVRTSDLFLPSGEREYSSASGILRVKQRSGTRPERRPHMDSCGYGPDTTPEFLQPGESRVLTFELAIGDKDNQLRPGDHEAAYIYYAKQKQLIKDAPEDVASNIVTFTVK